MTSWVRLATLRARPAASWVGRCRVMSRSMSAMCTPPIHSRQVTARLARVIATRRSGTPVSALSMVGEMRWRRSSV